MAEPTTPISAWWLDPPLYPPDRGRLQLESGLMRQPGRGIFSAGLHGLLGAGCFAMGACSGSETQTVAVAPPSQVVPLSWSGELGAADKQLFMLHKVSPTLAKVFQTVDASEYGNFGCISCHGLMRELPSEFLPELNVEQGQITAFVDQPQIAQFMKDQVVPAMLQVMGTAEYGAQNRAWSAEANFGCAGCHRLSAPLKPFP